MSNKHNSERGSVGRKVAIGIAVLVVIVAIVAGIVANNKKHAANNPTNSSAASSEAKQAADAFLSATRKGDVDSSWNMMTKANQARLTSKEVWAELLRADASKNITSPKYIKTVVDTDDKSAYKGKQLNYISYSYQVNGSDKTETVFVIKEDGAWKIEGLDVQ